ncbi:MAG: maleylacetoacetate isomerase [Betaproteobacteria bacterium]|nr:MAG: maleylacetoacetate isomerase [Betaproteobacteria bacterium]
MKLYTFFRSSAAFRMRIALNCKGLAYEPQVVSLPRDEHKLASYLEVHPHGLVPALEDGGKIYVQSLAMMEYLEETRPKPPLLPASAEDRAYVRALAQIIACEIHPLNNLRTLRYVKKTYALDEDGVNLWYRHWIAEGLRGLEVFIASSKKSGRFSYRDQVTIADCCLVPQVFNAQRYHCDLAPYPAVMAIFAECMKLDAFIDAQPDRQPDAA